MHSGGVQMELRWIAAGMLLLILGTLPHFLRRKASRAAGSRSMPRPPDYCRLKLRRKTEALMRLALRLPADTMDVRTLKDSACSLMERLLLTRQRVKELPPLPAAPDREPRLLDPARDLADDGWHSTDELLEALHALHTPDALPSEVSSLPVCIAAAQHQRLSVVLRAMLTDGRARAAGKHFVRRFLRCKRPEQLLAKSALNTVALSAARSLLHAGDAPALLSLLDAWLASRGLDPESLAEADLQRQLSLAEEIRAALQCFTRLEGMNWAEVCEEADSLHRALLSDPSGVYPRMTRPSRSMLRQRIENVSRHTGVELYALVQAAADLSSAAPDTPLERYIGSWFQSRKGLATLRRRLPGKKGWTYCRLKQRCEEVRYALLWLISLAAGFAFLQSGEPVLMLPAFLLVLGAASRWLLDKAFAPEALPALALDKQGADFRTLVVHPAVLHDPHEAIRLVRQIKTLRHGFSGGNADFLLLGDFAPSMTAVSSGDYAIVEAASAAVAALEDEHVLYMQRSRAWQPELYQYCPRRGRSGALEDICRLICQGECEDVIAFATTEAARLERRYAYVLALPSGRLPAPDMLDTLLQTIAHPLCERFPTPEGMRGFSILSPEGTDRFEGVGLIQPDAYLEATDGLLPLFPDMEPLAGELAGHRTVPGAHIQQPSGLRSWDDLYLRSHQFAKLLGWQLPWVKTPSGVVGNPLRHLSKFRLREPLRKQFVPLGQCGLLLWAVLTQSWPLLLCALVLPELGTPVRRPQDLLLTACRLSLLPSRMAVSVFAVIDALLGRRPRHASWDALETWAQGLAATVLAALGIALPGFALPALIMAVAFACFPLAHRYLSAPVLPTEGLTEEQHALLADAAAATWQYFASISDESTHFLPRERQQYEPPLAEEPFTTPEAVAASLLACVCAKELGYLSASAAAAALANTLEGLRGLPTPQGLPCRRYRLADLTIQDASVDARSTGFLLAALMTAAQALRTWLPELPPEQADISGQITILLDSWDISALFDQNAGLFYALLDENGQGQRHIANFTDEGILLSVAAFALGKVPPAHFQRLRRTRIDLPRASIPVTETGSAAAHLLAGLFLPISERDALQAIRAMQKCGRDGLFGQGECGCWQFDAALRYQTALFGIQAAALSALSAASVFAPYAAALCLPFAPHDAAAALARFQSLGARGPQGFCDAVDLSQGTALVGMHSTWRQGVLLAALAHLLADSPVRQNFTALPGVEACLPLLEPISPPLRLPRLPIQPAEASRESAFERPAQTNTIPPETQLLGTEDLRILASANGCTAIFDGATPLTGTPQGLQFFLSDEGRTYRLGSSLQPVTVAFTDGVMKLEQLCGSVKAELLCAADTLRRRALHVVTITNLSTLDRLISLTDFLPPRLSASADTLEIFQPDKHHLSAHDRSGDISLHHVVQLSQPALALTACTDADALHAQLRALHSSATVEEPFGFLSAADGPCLSFHARLALGGRGQITLWFTTSLVDAAPPQLAEISSIRRLAALQDQAIAQAAGLTEDLRHCADLLTGLAASAGQRLCLLLRGDDSTGFLNTLHSVADWFALHGMKLRLTVVHPEALSEATSEILAHWKDAGDAELLSEAAFIPRDHPLLLCSDLPLRSQLEALYTSISPAHQPAKRPLPALLPRKELLFQGSYGGFDSETSDYLLQLEPGQTPPAAWRNRHINRNAAETVDESGFIAPFREQLWLRMADGTWLSPWSPELPRMVRMGAGHTVWEAWSDKLDLKLSAALLPDGRNGLRLLALRNATDEPLPLRLTVLVPFSGTLECAPGIVMSSSAAPLHPYLAGEDWTARRTCSHAASAWTSQPWLDAPDSDAGQTALLSREVTLPPYGSSHVCWLSGFARHGEDVARFLARVQAEGASSLLRSVHSAWHRQLDVLRLSTPEDTLTLLLNRLLPAQALCARGAACVPALSLFAPRTAKRALLQAARHAESRREWAHIALAAAECIRITGDGALPVVWLPRQEASLYDCCTEALTSLPLDERGLPDTDDYAADCFLFALAAQRLDQLRPNETLRERSRSLLNAADTYLWQDGHYGAPLRLDVQLLAALGYDANPRTRQAMRTCWAVLYDRPHGLMRRQEPADDAALLPGLPQNGGMVTLDAACCLQALLRTEHLEEAFELLRALNPLHHTDDPLRQETFRGAPYLLPGGMCASPLEAGQAAAEGGAEAAASLYAIVIQHVLGFRREGSVIRMEPCIPPEWDGYTLTLREGASTWRISVERRVLRLTVDGQEQNGNSFTIADDGKIHQVHVPLT